MTETRKRWLNNISKKITVSRTIKSQEEFDNLPDTMNEHCIIIAFGTLSVPAKIYKNINGAEIRIAPNIYAIIYNDTFVRAMPNSYIAAYDYSTVVSTRNTHIYAHDNSFIIALERDIVRAYDNARIESYEYVTVLAYNNSTILAFHTSIVKALEKSKVIAHDKSCVAMMSEHQIYAYDLSTIRVYKENSKIAAYNQSNIICDKLCVIDAHNAPTIDTKGNKVIIIESTDSYKLV